MKIMKTINYRLIYVSIASIVIFYTLNNTVLVQAQADCNAIYATEMAQALNDLQSQLDSINQVEARRYMSLLKQQRDIEQQLNQYEQVIFRNNINTVIGPLHVPLNNYINCQLSIVQSLSQNTPTTTATDNTCNAQYQQDMTTIMATGPGIADIMSEAQISRPETIDFGQAARNYMIDLKLQRDISQQIQDLEHNRFNSDLIARMRIPLNRYNDCYTTYFSNSSLVRTPLPTNINISRQY
jgi:hypothetical protein